MREFLAIYYKDGKVDRSAIHSIEDDIDIIDIINNYNNRKFNLSTNRTATFCVDDNIVNGFRWYSKNTDTRHSAASVVDTLKDLIDKLSDAESSMSDYLEDIVS